MKSIIIILIAVALALLALFLLLYPKDKCPYCGSKNIETTKMDATINYARWNAKCRDCHKEFYIK